MFYKARLFTAFVALLVCSGVNSVAALSGGAPLAHCGDMYAPPFASASDGRHRSCPPAVRRAYAPRHRGIGFEILDSESKACFVPDQAYRLLDEIVDAVAKDIKYNPDLPDRQAKIAQAQQISRKISDTLRARGFALYIPTETLSDALIDRNLPGEPERHVFDCDTGSFIFLTVTENLGAPVSLVGISLPSGSSHYYARWRIDDQTSMDWDMNGQAECATPVGLASYEGRSMSRQEALGYALTLRAWQWEVLGRYDEAISDYHQATILYPQAPVSYNNFAWLIATKEVPDRVKLRQDALAAAQQAIAISRKPNYLDTLGCVYALLGDFQQAIKYQSEAVEKDPRNSAFQERLALFRGQKDCTGAK